jgi:hypothetical protein
MPYFTCSLVFRLFLIACYDICATKSLCPGAGGRGIRRRTEVRCGAYAFIGFRDTSRLPLIILSRDTVSTEKDGVEYGIGWPVWAWVTGDPPNFNFIHFPIVHKDNRGRSRPFYFFHLPLP